MSTGCPVLGNTSRNYFPANETFTIDIVGGPFYDGSLYTCLLYNLPFGDTNLNNTIFTASNFSYLTSTTELQCTFPAQVMGYANFTILADGEPYVYSPPLDVEIYDCNYNNSQNDCPSCQLNPSKHCGWCFAYSPISGCRDIDVCSTSNTTEVLWLNNTCPEISAINPPYVSQHMNTTISVSTTYLFPGLNYSCSIGFITHATEFVPATIVNAHTLSCELNPSQLYANVPSTGATVDSSILTIYLFDAPYTTLRNSQQASSTVFLDFLDCAVSSNDRFCDRCVTKDALNRCTWCEVQGICEVSYNCNASYPIALNESLCLSVDSITPIELPLSGGTITVNGSNFFDYNQIYCQVGTTKVPATYVNKTTYTCIIPAVNADSQLQFDFLINNISVLPTKFQLGFANFVTTGLSPGAIGGIAGGFGFCVILLVVLFAYGFYVYKTRLAKKKLKEPNYRELAIGNSFEEWKVPNSDTKKLYDDLVVLLREANFQIPVVLTEICPTNELDKICKALVFAQEGKDANKGVDMICRFISDDISKLDEDVLSIFPQNSPVSKMLTHYDKLIGLKWLWQILAVPVHELNDLAIQESGENPQNDISRYETSNKTAMQSSFYRSTSFEIDPSKMDDVNKAFLNENVIRLMLYAQHLFNAVVGNVTIMPKQLRTIYKHARDRMNARYPANERKAVSNLLFLRFVCPSLLTPHVWGLLEEPPNENSQRYLILLSKTLHNLSTGTLAGQKEEYMHKLNEFITMNQEAFKDLCDEITDKELIDQGANSESDMPDDTYYQALAYLHNILVQEHENIIQKLSRRDSSPFGDETSKVDANNQNRLADKFTKLLKSLGESPQPKQDASD